MNTQFQYIDVGVNVELTPSVHPNRDVSLKLQVDSLKVGETATVGVAVDDVSGLFSIVIKGLAPGTSAMSIMRVSARDSKQRPIELATTDANIRVAP